MKLLHILFFMVMLCPMLNAQGTRNRCGEVFSKDKYPPDSFSIREQIYEMGNTRIILTFLHHDYLGDDSDFCQIWFAQKKGKRIIKSKYCGMEGNTGMQLLDKQPLNDYFIIYENEEVSGTYYLISKTGKWYELPGNDIYWDANKSLLFTYFIPWEYCKCTIARFDLKSKKMLTKIWDGKGPAWSEVKDKASLIELFENAAWLSWK